MKNPLQFLSSYPFRRCIHYGFLLLVSSITCIAQSKVSGVVEETKGKPLSFTNVLLLQAQDSSLVKGTVTDEGGNYHFENISNGSYRIKALMIGYKPAFSSAFLISDANYQVPTLELQADVQVLEEVSVTALKPLYEQQPDRMVVNVRQSITSAGNSALEILERSPGVTVNTQSGSFSLNGKEGVGVMINGKLSRMPLNALIDMLRGMNGANVEKIELITNPPASYDAEGAGGLINIVLHRQSEYGTNGSVSATAGFGYGEKGAVSMALNHRTRSLSVYGDYSTTRDRRIQRAEMMRTYLSEGLPAYSRNTSYRLPVISGHTARAGFDYQAGSRTSIGGLLSGYSTQWEVNSENHSYTGIVGQKEKFTRIDNHEINLWQHLMGNLNLTQTFKPDQQLRVDVDYLWYNNNNPSSYTDFITGGDRQQVEFEVSKKTPIQMGVVKVDYRQPIGGKLSWETGLKGNFSLFENRIGFQPGKGTEGISFPVISQEHYLTERIVATYSSFQWQMAAKTRLLAGLRYEYTHTNLETDTEKGNFNRRYGNLFPNLLLSYELSKDNSLQLSYGRRITRPALTDLASFVLLVGPDNLIAGNTGLQPALSHALKLQYGYKNLITSLQYNYETNTIAGLQPHFNPAEETFLYAPENLRFTQTLTLMTLLTWQLTSWWSTQNTLMGTWQRAKATYLENPKQVSLFNVRFNHTQTFSLPYTFTLEVSGYYQSPMLLGINRIRRTGMLNLGLQKKLNKDKGSFSLTWEDLLWTTPWLWDVSLPEYSLKSHAAFYISEPRIVRLTYARQFGNQKLKVSRKVATGSEEEQKRIGN